MIILWTIGIVLLVIGVVWPPPLFLTVTLGS